MTSLTPELIDKFIGTGLFLEVINDDWDSPKWLEFYNKRRSSRPYYVVCVLYNGLPDDSYSAQTILDEIDLLDYWSQDYVTDCIWTGDTISYDELVEMCEEFGAVRDMED
jgi:hypothetical protein